MVLEIRKGIARFFITVPCFGQNQFVNLSLFKPGPREVCACCDGIACSIYFFVGASYFFISVSNIPY